MKIDSWACDVLKQGVSWSRSLSDTTSQVKWRNYAHTHTDHPRALKFPLQYEIMRDKAEKLLSTKISMKKQELQSQHSKINGFLLVEFKSSAAIFYCFFNPINWKDLIKFVECELKSCVKLNWSLNILFFLAGGFLNQTIQAVPLLVHNCNCNSPLVKWRFELEAAGFAPAHRSGGPHHQTGVYNNMGETLVLWLVLHDSSLSSYNFQSRRLAVLFFGPPKI